MTLTVVILTRNEAHHIVRALGSISAIADRIFVIDSGSSDETVSLAKAAGATVVVHPFVHQAQQFNWALGQLPADTEWVMRLDADEVVTKELAKEIEVCLPMIGPDVSGIYVSRRMTFLRRPIRWGGVFPIRVVRLFRFGTSRYENRWMDEHLIVKGPTANFKGEILDDNLGSLGAWIAKHNSYASREVVDILNATYGFMHQDSVARLRGGGQAGKKRWLKEHIYNRLPSGFRALFYFSYRYVVRLGFLDGYQGTAFHVLQGFWYRFLVDAKLFEIDQYMNEKNVDVYEAIEVILDIKLDSITRAK